MSNKVVINICNLIQLGSIIALAGIGLKRNNDCYKAEMELIDTRVELYKTKIDNICKEAEIRILKEELAGLKAEKKTEES